MAASGFEMDAQLAMKAYDGGAFMVLLHLPVGSEFGIDCKSWTVADKFRGIKMIPPGVHFVYFSAQGESRSGQRAPRIGFFHHFHSKEVHVRKWDCAAEDLADAAAADHEVERIRSNLRDMDSMLAPYPYDTYKRWFSLTGHLSAGVLDKLMPASGRISAQCNLISKEQQEEKSSGGAECSSRVDRSHPVRKRYSDHQGLPIMHVAPDDSIPFSDVDCRHADKALSGAERTRRGMDASERLCDVVRQRYDGDEAMLLGEMQFAFALFLLGHVFAGFEQWKSITVLLCDCRDAVNTRPKLFHQFMMVLHYQLKECPADFFVDIVDKDNFLTKSLGKFFATVRSSEVDKDNGLAARAAKFERHVSRAFNWDFGGATAAAAAAAGDDAQPVLVQLDEAQMRIAATAEMGPPVAQAEAHH